MKKLLKRKYVLILLAIAGVILLANGLYSSQYVTYRVDQSNKCIWVDGAIKGQTAAAERNKNIKVKKTNEAEFLKDAQENGVCAERI